MSPRPILIQLFLLLFNQIPYNVFFELFNCQVCLNQRLSGAEATTNNIIEDRLQSLSHNLIFSVSYCISVLLIHRLYNSNRNRYQILYSRMLELPKRESEEDRELSYGELQQSLIDTYRDGHFKTIEYAEKLLEQYKRQLARAENTKGQEKIPKNGSQTEKELKI